MCVALLRLWIRAAQLGFRPELIVHATSSGGTQTGLIAGMLAANVDCDDLGINVYDTDHDRIERRMARLLDEVLGQLRIDANATGRVRIVHEFLGEDYGIPTRQTLDAIATLASTEGRARGSCVFWQGARRACSRWFDEKTFKPATTSSSSILEEWLRCLCTQAPSHLMDGTNSVTDVIPCKGGIGWENVHRAHRASRPNDPSVGSAKRDMQ